MSRDSEKMQPGAIAHEFVESASFVSEPHGQAIAATIAASPGEEVPESKNALKRRLKAEKWESEKKQKRKDIKMRKKTRAQAQKELSNWTKVQNGEAVEEPIIDPIRYTEEEMIEMRRQRKEAKNEADRRYLESCASNHAVVIDCLWEEHHSERALKSLSQQIYFSYGLNKRSPNPVALYLTGVGPLLRKQLYKQGMTQWLGPTDYSMDYMELPQFQRSAINPAESPVVDICITGVGKEELNSSYRHALTVNKKQLVYLSSDAEETIDALDPNCAYVIGGIVDRNRLKGITHKKATDQQLRTVKLPIRDHLASKLTTTHVLTVNHCVELLLERQTLGEWPAAVDKVIPLRKMKAAGEPGNDGEEQQDEDDDEEEEDAEDADADEEVDDA